MTNSPLTHYQPEPENYTQHIAVGVGILSFFIAAAVSPFVGVGVALYFVHRYLDKDKLEADREGRERQLEQGRQQSFAQALQSLPHGGEMQIPQNLSWRDGSLAAFIEAMESHEKRGREQQQQQQQTPALIGMNTKLGAIPTQAIALPSSPAADVQPPPGAPPPPALVDVPLGVASYQYLLSRIFLGGSRSGKSLLVALTIRHLRKRFGSKLQVWVISAAYRPAESWYWEVADQVSCIDFPKASPYEIRTAYENWGRMLEQFTAIPADVENPKLLILDEASMIGSTADLVGTEESKGFWQAIKMKANHLSSAGAASGMGIYLIAPVGAVASLNLTRAELGAFFPIFTSGIDQWNEAVYIAAKSNGLAPQNPPTAHTFAEARSVKAESIIGISGKWLPYQRYDLAQSRKVEKTAAVPVAVPTGDSPTPQGSEDRFSQLQSKLIAPEQSELRSFIEWLSTQKGKEITFDQVKGNWARRNATSRDKSHLESLLAIAKSQKLLKVLPNTNYQVADD
jgi:hypothetical protein